MKKLFTAILSAILFFGLNTANAENSNGTPGMIKFQTNGGPDANAYYVPAGVATDKVLVIFHEAFGLNDNIKQEAQYWSKIFDGKVAIYAVDMYDGKVTTEKFEATKLMNNMDSKRGEAIVKGILQKIGNGKQIATLGWGFGNTWAFTAATIAGSKAAGCVMYYGSPIIKDESRISQLKTDVVYLLGNNDESTSVAELLEFGKKLTNAGRGFTYETFSGGNGFASLGNPKMTATERMETGLMAQKFLAHKLGLD